jgi:signal transduction histidine kinase
MQNMIKNTISKLTGIHKIFGGKSIMFLCVALAIAMMTIFFTDNWILKIKSQDAQITESRKIILSLNQFKTNIYQAESDQRGYIITQKSYYLASYDNAVNGAKLNLSELDKLIPKNDEDSLDKLKVTLEAKLTEMKITSELIKSDKLKNAMNVVNLDHGLEQTIKLNLIADDLLKRNQLLLTNYIKNRIKSNDSARSAVIFGPLLLILLVVLVIRQLFIELADKNKTQLLLSEINTTNQAKLDDQANMLSELALSNLADIERERHHLARELHDELGSILTATKMDISWVLKTLKDSQPLIVAKLKKTSTYIDKGIHFKREIVQNLHPPMLSSFGFWPGLRNMIEDNVERNQWQLDLILPDEEIKINETIGLVAYRVIQETLNNCSKYAHAKKISLHLVCDSANLKIEVQDDGIGLDLSTLQNASTHGIKGMRHRVQSIGGSYKLTSQKGSGLNVVVILPLNKNFAL